jgi:hypothetical protein
MKVNVLLPTGMLVGLKVVIWGLVVRIKLAELEVAWLTGSVTVMVAVPALLSKAFGTVTVMAVELKPAETANCVLWLLNVKFTIGEFVGKLLPLRFSVRSADGLMKEKLGLRVLRLGAGLMTKFSVLVVTPIEVSVTETVAVPATVRKEAGTVAVIRLAVGLEKASDEVTPPKIQFT